MAAIVAVPNGSAICGASQIGAFTAFPGAFHIPLPTGGEVVVYPGDGGCMVMDMDRHGDGGNTVGTFPSMPAAIAAGRVWAARHYGVTA